MELEVWKVAMQLAEEIFIVTKKFPKEEIYGLTKQIRSCSVSVPSNISEGADRQTTKEFLQFLRIAKGSLAETQTQIILAKGFAYISERDYLRIEQLIIRIRQMLISLRNALTNKLSK